MWCSHKFKLDNHRQAACWQHVHVSIIFNCNASIWKLAWSSYFSPVSAPKMGTIGDLCELKLMPWSSPIGGAMGWCWWPLSWLKNPGIPSNSEKIRKASELLFSIQWDFNPSWCMDLNHQSGNFCVETSVFFGKLLFSYGGFSIQEKLRPMWCPGQIHRGETLLWPRFSACMDAIARCQIYCKESIRLGLDEQNLGGFYWLKRSNVLTLLIVTDNWTFELVSNSSFLGFHWFSWTLLMLFAEW